MSGIEDSQISVVVQGPVVGQPSAPPDQRWTQRALASVRHVLPGAEIVLSTWMGTDTTGLSFDVLIENEDPGGTPYWGGTVLNNVNRQIVSSRTGIQASSRPYVLKMRSETLIVSDGFRSYFGKYSANCPGKYVEERVIASTLFSTVPREFQFGACYCPSDWFYFGLKEDLLRIWDIPQAPQPETNNWFLSRPFPDGIERQNKLRYAAEQYIWVSFLRKYGPVDFDSFWDVRRNTVGNSERSIAANLVLVSPKEAGLQSIKYAAESLVGDLGHIRLGCYSYRHWKALYARHCGGGHSFRKAYLVYFEVMRALIRGYHACGRLARRASRNA